MNENSIPFSKLPEETKKLFLDLQNRHEEARKKYGVAGSPNSAVFKGVRLVTVGNQFVQFDPNKTYLDFLSYFLKSIIGTDWGNIELKKPHDEQHQIIELYKKVADQQKNQARSEGRFYALDKSGALNAWYQLAYDLHVLSQNLALNEFVLNRLKNKDQYQGARYELSVAAVMIRAGFEVGHQDEKGGSTSHFEFTAKDKGTGEIIAVEVKSKHRAGVLDFDLENGKVDHKKINVKHLLGNVLKKETRYPLIIFTDLNMPPIDVELQNSFWAKEIEKTIRNKEQQYKAGMPANAFIFTNHPHHYEDDTTPNPLSSWMITRTSNPRYLIENEEVINKIAETLTLYENIPSFFDDQETSLGTLPSAGELSR